MFDCPSKARGVVTLAYTLRADMSRIRVGNEVTPGPADALWKHTCFEAFLRPGQSSGYYEFNFSPTRAVGGLSLRRLS